MKISDLVYIERIEGKEKPSFHKLGIMIEKDDGKRSIKLNSLPVNKNWDGWLSVVEQKSREEAF